MGDDVVKLVATIDKNLPPLIHSAETEGRILVDEVHNLSVSGKAVLDASGLDSRSKSTGKTTMLSGGASPSPELI